MQLRSFGLSDVGKKREKNEDSFLVADEVQLYAVADGMGGHLGGDFASKMAVATVKETIDGLEADPDMTLQEEAGVAVRVGEYQGYLRYSISLASRRIYERATADSSLHGMGTTMVALLFRNNKVYVANVGDSRVYRVRGDAIIQITKDHSLVGEQIRAGLLSEADARVHKFKNIITRSVGFQAEVDADIDIRVVREGDRFLLCSDGLSNMVQNDELRDVIATNAPEPACRRLIDIANERGGDDNITAVVVEVVGLDEELPSVNDEATIES